MLEPNHIIAQIIRAFARLAVGLMMLMILALLYFRIDANLESFQNPPVAAGIYVDVRGYGLILRRNKHYRMCDVKSCIEGTWHDAPAPRSFMRQLRHVPPLRQVTLENVYTTALGQRFYRNVRMRHQKDWHLLWHQPQPFAPASPHLVGQIENCRRLVDMPCLAYGHAGETLRKAASFADPDTGAK